jgi:TPR repeat protein/MinD-like ATPase involved in chromosome partitioning or flagellar assembly
MTSVKCGRIISFYSFKGGVGRSMALANIAALLCRSGKSVLVVDWDLEAPGLHKFFQQSSRNLKQEISRKYGILDILYNITHLERVSWRDCLIQIPIGDRSLDFLSAGRQDSSYSEKLHALNWHLLYDEYDIGEVFENMRQDWGKAYDFAILDSRTGVTDIGDVCTALLPDILVTVFVANDQNIEGTKLIVERARTVHGKLPRDRSKLIIVPLLGRDESHTEYELSSIWRARISEELRFTLSDWLPKELDASTYFQKIFIPYYSYWSFGENIPVIQREQEIENPNSISAAYARLATLLESGLDWSALNQGENLAELHSLRSRAAVGEAKNVALQQRLRLSRGYGIGIAVTSFIAAFIIMMVWTVVTMLSEKKEAQVHATIAETTLAQVQTKMDESIRAAIAPMLVARASTQAELEKTQRQLGDTQAKLVDALERAEKAQAQIAQASSAVIQLIDRDGSQRDDSEIARLYKLAADQGNANAQNNLGQFYALGRGGLQKDEREAARLYKLAADQGNANAQVNLGLFYEQGLGGLQMDEREAARLYKLAADQGDAQGQLHLGFLYENGEGLPKDEREAARLYKLAADQGNARGQANLADFYERGGGGLVRNDREAARLYKLAADQGYAYAQRSLGEMYESGRGVTKNSREAARLYKLAAAQGDKYAQDALNRLRTR